jgi:endoglycosylceramidase
LRFTLLIPCLLGAITLLAACSDSDNSPNTSQASIDPSTALPTVAELVPLRPLSVSDDLRIVDDLNREVLLRGVNLNSLGEYWQGEPDHYPTIATDAQDWPEMAARGISVVRLVVNWS